MYNKDQILQKGIREKIKRWASQDFQISKPIERHSSEDQLKDISLNTGDYEVLKIGRGGGGGGSWDELQYCE